MCSACTRRSPPAVKRAAEQSARSLMFGLKAARRSTAPISSAMPVRRARSTARPAGPRRHRAVPDPARHPPQHEAPARPTGAPAGGHPDRAVGLGDDGGTGDGAAVGRGQVGDGDRARHRGPGPHGDHLDGVVGPGVAVAPGVQRRGRRPTDSTVSSWLWPGSDSRARSYAQRRRPSAPSAAAASAARAAPGGVEAGVVERRRPRAHEVDLLGRGEQTQRPRTRRPGPGRSPPACRARRPARRRAAGPAPPKATSASPAGSTPRSTDTTRSASRHAASTTVHHVAGRHTGPAPSASAAAATSSRPMPGNVARRRDAPEHQVGVGDRRLAARPARSTPAPAPRPPTGGRRPSAPPASMAAIEPPPAPIVWTSRAGSRTG